MIAIIQFIALLINIILSFVLFFINISAKDLPHISIAVFLLLNSIFSIWSAISLYRQYWLPMQKISTKTKEVLNQAGIALKDNELKNIAHAIDSLQETEKQIKWQNDGFLRLNELLSIDTDLDTFATKALQFFGKYTQALAGCFYLLDYSNKNNFYVLASQGFSKQSILQRDLSIQNGLLGAVFQTQEKVYLTDIKNIPSIESGFFEKSPVSVLILPLAIAMKKQGVIEIAFDRELTPAEIQFLEKVAFAIASHIADLLQEAAIQRLMYIEKESNVALKAQEEELRQNLEELNANQLQLDEQVRVTEQIRKELAARVNVLDKSALLTESDLFGTITYANQKFCEVSGYEITECLGKPHSIVRHPNTPKEIFREMWATIQAGRIFQATYANKTKKGNTYWVEANIAPVFDEMGKIVKYIGIRFDVTQRVLHEQQIEATNEILKQQELALNQQNDQLLTNQEKLQEQIKITIATKNELASRVAVLDNAAIVTESDIYRTITYANQKFCESSGYSLAECIGKPHNINRHPDMPKEMFKEMWDTIKNGGIYKGIIKNKTKYGEPYWVDATIAPVLGENGQPIKYISVRFDITQQVTQATQIEELLQAALDYTKELETKEEQLQEINETLEEKVEERTVELQQQAEHLRLQNDQIEGSIRYAKRLQNALLPSVNDLQQLLPESFVFRLPQHIVSGDFFWAEMVNNQIIVIVADCTGHGVPGAFMTILGNTLLNEIILQHHITQPDEILLALDQKLASTLKYQPSKYHVADGMDAIAVTIDQINEKIYFAGAKNPLYYGANGEFQQIKGSRFPIGDNNGHYQMNKVFEKHTIETTAGMMLYLTTDGYQDQSGGENKAKFMTKHFRNLLQHIHTQPIEDQQKIVEQVFDEWKGKNKQTDDITVIGIKLHRQATHEE
jgi:PAS domain S-box-containing protein